MHTAEAAGATSAYDVAAPSFDAYRSLPSGVAATVRAAALDAAGSPQPRVLGQICTAGHNYFFKGSLA